MSIYGNNEYRSTFIMHVMGQPPEIHPSWPSWDPTAQHTPSAHRGREVNPVINRDIIEGYPYIML